MCQHDLGTPVSRYDQVEKKLFSHVVCDHCGTALFQVHEQDYEPKPDLDACVRLLEEK